MVRAFGKYTRFKGRSFYRYGERYIHLGDLLDWLLLRFNIHIKHARQLQADELDDVTAGLDLEDTELE